MQVLSGSEGDEHNPRLCPVVNFIPYHASAAQPYTWGLVSFPQYLHTSGEHAC